MNPPLHGWGIPTAWLIGFVLASWTIFAIRMHRAVEGKSPQARAQHLRVLKTGTLFWCLVFGIPIVILTLTGLWVAFPDPVIAIASHLCGARLLDGQLDMRAALQTGRGGLHTIFCQLDSGERLDIGAMVLLPAIVVYTAIPVTLLMWLSRYGLRPARKPGDPLPPLAARIMEQRDGDGTFH